jgi:hypothetical protein
MQLRALNPLFVTLLVITVSLPALAQAKKAPESPKPQAAPGWSEWQTMTPEGEEFTVLMPKSPATETGKYPYHKMELNTRFYLSSLTGGPLLAIASFSGIKSNPAAYSDFERFNSYVDAFKDFFATKVKPGTLIKLSPIGNKPLHGHPGRQFKVTFGDLSGPMQAYITRKRFYAIVSLNTKKDEALDEKFISSFVLPERVDKPANTAVANSEGIPNTASDPNAAGQAQGTSRGVRKEGTPATEGGTTPVATVSEDNTEAGVANVPNATANQGTNQPGQQNQKRAPLSGGMLNGKAIYMPSPEAPSGEASGVVIVQILVDEQGAVVEARAVAGPPALHVPAVNAARLARFNPTFMMGEAVRVSGTLSYNFVRSN